MKLKLFYLSALSLLYVSCKTYDGKSFEAKRHEILPEEILSLDNDTLILEKNDSYSMEEKRKNLIGGSDAAMGYTYSRLLDKKIRIFEAGVRVLSTTNPNATSAGYVVFADDSSKVELFLLEHEQTTILNKAANDDGTVVWRMEGSDLMLEKSKDKWSVTKDDKLIYSSK